jgi:hypothetical protein
MIGPTLQVEWWKNEGYFQGGCWALVLGNKHLFAEAAQKGRHKPTEIRLRKIALMWNANLGREELERQWERRT